MATGEGFGRSWNRECDNYFDYSCTPCSADDKNVEATNFCVECEEYFCVKCVKDNHRFGKLKTHTILDQAGMKSRGRQQTTSQPTEKCQLHHGNILDTFCVRHDAVCCGTCVTLFHKSCKGMECLPAAAVGIQKSKELKYVKSDIKKLQVQLNKMKDIRQDELRSLDACKDMIQIQIKNFRKRVIKRLDELEKIAADELQAKHQMFQKQINDDIKNLEEMLTLMETTGKKLEVSTGDNASQIFVFVKTGQKNGTDGRKLLRDMESQPGNRELMFRINPNIEDYINTQNSIGDFQVVQEVEQVYSASLYGEFDMKVSSDTSVCNISGSCIMEDGTVLVPDYNNNKLKRLSRSYQVRDYCDLSGTPFAVCATCPQEVAVTLLHDKMIQFVSIGDKMKTTRSFPVEGDSAYCHGVAYSNNQLFVACIFPEAVLVYNMSGNLLKTIQQDKISSPRHITASRDQTKLYIADADKGLITLGIHGDIQSQFTDPDIVCAYGVCLGNNDEMFVCGYRSYNILQIDRDGSKLGVVLGEADGIKYPESLCWDRANSRLIVTVCDTNHIKVFNMKS